MAGDNPYITKKIEVLPKSDMCLLTVGDNMSPEAIRLKDAQEHMNLQIAKAQESVMSLVDKLAAYYPDGHYGVLNAMPKGPAQDYAAMMVKRQEQTFKPSPTTFA